MGHERVLQRIANQNGGTRASGTPGFRASVNYVRQTLRQANYDVRLQQVDFNFFQELALPELSEISPTPRDFETATFQYSGSGEVTGALVRTTDIVIPPGPTASTSNSGCQPEDSPTPGRARRSP